MKLPGPKQPAVWLVMLGIFGTRNVPAETNVWTSLGQENRPVTALAIEPQTGAVYAASTSGLFKSTDQGAGWSAVKPGPPCCLSTLVIDPQTPGILYGLSQDRKVLKSVDGGANWSPVNSGVTSLVIDPQNPATLYAGSGLPGGGVFKTTDGGESWIAVSTGLPDVGIAALAINPQEPGTLYASARGLFRSTDGGASWTAVNSGLDSDITLGYSYISAIAIDAQNPDTLYVAGTGTGLYKSTDAGGRWKQAGRLAADSVLVLAADARNPGTVYAATSAGIFKSTDSAVTWSALKIRLTSDASGPLVIPALAIDPQNPDNLYAASTYTGILQTTDAGASWATVNSDLRVSSPTGRMVLRFDPQNPGTIYAGTDFGLLRTTDNGASWTAINAGLPSDGNGHLTISALEIDPRDPNTIYAMYQATYADMGEICGASCYGALFKSTNGGAYWGTPNTVFGSRLYTSANVLILDPQNPGTVYTAGEYIQPGPKGGGNGVLKSGDGGATWLVVNSGITVSSGQSVNITTLAIDPQIPTTLYAGTWQVGSLAGSSAVYLTTSGGFSWRNAGLTGFRSVDVLAIDPRDPNTVYARAAAPSGGLFKTRNAGANWDPVSGLPAVVSALVFDSQNPGVVYAATDSGVFRSTDDGTSWNAVNSGLTSLAISAVAIDPRDSSIVYAGGAGGVFAINFLR